MTRMTYRKIKPNEPDGATELTCTAQTHQGCASCNGFGSTLIRKVGGPDQGSTGSIRVLWVKMYDVLSVWN